MQAHVANHCWGSNKPVALLSQPRTSCHEDCWWCRLLLGKANNMEEVLVCGIGADLCPLCLVPTGQSVRQLQLTYNDFFPDYFSLAEKPPAEFCLSPDGNTESISIDLLQKKGESVQCATECA